MSNQPLSKETSHMYPATTVTSTSQAKDMLEAFSNEPLVAVDTESNSLYAYQEQVCLIQFSIPGADYLFDPLTGLNASMLADLFADPETQKVFHAAEYDVMCLKRDFGFHFVNLFDTMLTAHILGWPRVGLGNLLEENFDVHTKKRYQRYNWGKRPLDPEALTYARLDTHYLLPLHRLQSEALIEKGHTEEAREIFSRVAASPAMPPTFDPEDFWSVKGAYDLNGRERAVLRALYAWRDKEARRQDRPLFKVLHDDVLIELVHTRPQSLKKLTSVKGLNRYHARRYGKHILHAIKRGLQAQPPRLPPPPPRHSEAEMDRFHVLHDWRKRTAAKRGVNSSIIVSKSTLWDLAEQNPRTLEDLSRIDGLGPWRRKTYGQTILKILEC